MLYSYQDPLHAYPRAARHLALADAPTDSIVVCWAAREQGLLTTWLLSTEHEVHEARLPRRGRGDTRVRAPLGMPWRQVLQTHPHLRYRRLEGLLDLPFGLVASIIESWRCHFPDPGVMDLAGLLQQQQWTRRAAPLYHALPLRFLELPEVTAQLAAELSYSELLERLAAALGIPAWPPLRRLVYGTSPIREET